MEFQVKCECGKPMTVSAAAAGASLPCGCGRTVVVPSLSELRRQHGLPAYDAHPVQVLQNLLAAGELPEGQSCVICGKDTLEVMTVVVECEKSPKRQRGLFSWRNIPWVLWWWVLFCTGHVVWEAEGQAEEPARALTFPLPLRVCEHCHPGLKGVKQIKQALREVPLYARLLERYPDARVKGAKS